MEIFGNKIKQKLSKKYCCEICYYNTDRKSNLNNHLLSAKHIKELNGNEIKQKISNNSILCENCNKVYETSAGLWKHKKKCFIKEEKKEIENNMSSELIIEIIKQNQDFKDLLIYQKIITLLLIIQIVIINHSILISF